MGQALWGCSVWQESRQGFRARPPGPSSLPGLLRLASPFSMQNSPAAAWLSYLLGGRGVERNRLPQTWWAAPTPCYLAPQPPPAPCSRCRPFLLLFLASSRPCFVCSCLFSCLSLSVFSLQGSGGRVKVVVIPKAELAPSLPVSLTGPDVSWAEVPESEPRLSTCQPGNFQQLLCFEPVSSLNWMKMVQGLKVVQRLIGCEGPAPGYASCWKVPPSFHLLGGWLRERGHPLPPPERPGQAQPKLPLAVETEALDPMWALPREYFCESIIRQMGKDNLRGRNAFYRPQKLFTWVEKNC